MINIHMFQATCYLGKALSNMARDPFICKDGKFASIEAYWYWLSTGAEELRPLWGWDAKKLGRELREIYCVDVVDFEHRICEAVKIKIANNPKLLEAFQKNNEQFTHTGIYHGGEVDMSTNCEFWLDMLNGLVKAKRMNRNWWRRYQYETE